MLPAVRKTDPKTQSQILKGTIKPFMIIFIISTVVLIVTGIFMTIGRMDQGINMLSTYGILLMVKHLLTLVIIVLGLLAGFYLFPKMQRLAKSGEKQKAAKVDKCLASIGHTNPILGIIIIVLSVIMPFFV
jgi:uncharacterized membrane protein